MTQVSSISLHSRAVTASPERPLAREMRPAEFASFVEAHQEKLMGFLFRYTRNRQDAEDLMQDTFVKAYRNLHRYDDRYSFSTWLYTIARRTAYNHFRDRKPTEELGSTLAEPSKTPDLEASREDEKNWVWKAVQNLKPDYQEALSLKYMEDLSIAEISKVMGKSQTNVKIILFRARNRLKKLRMKENPRAD